jgi:hypothetical protein
MTVLDTSKSAHDMSTCSLKARKWGSIPGATFGQCVWGRVKVELLPVDLGVGNAKKAVSDFLRRPQRDQPSSPLWGITQ